MQKLWLEIGRFAIALSANQHSISEKVKYSTLSFFWGLQNNFSTPAELGLLMQEKSNTVDPYIAGSKGLPLRKETGVSGDMGARYG